MLANYHTHTWRCNHATGTEHKYIEQAISTGIKILGFSDHAPYPFPNGFHSGFRMTCDQLQDYFTTLTSLRDEYRGDIEIHIGLEAEYYPLYHHLLKKFLSAYPCEYLICGQHFIGNEIDDASSYVGRPLDDPTILHRYVDQCLEGLSTGDFTYLAHADLCACVGHEDVYNSEYRRLCEGAKALGIPLEINMLGIRGHRQYPDERFWKLAGDVGNDVIIGCDAHNPESLNDPTTEKFAVAIAENNHVKLLSQAVLKNPN